MTETTGNSQKAIENALPALSAQVVAAALAQALGLKLVDRDERPARAAAIPPPAATEARKAGA